MLQITKAMVRRKTVVDRILNGTIQPQDVLQLARIAARALNYHNRARTEGVYRATVPQLNDRLTEIAVAITQVLATEREAYQRKTIIDLEIRLGEITRRQKRPTSDYEKLIGSIR